ncbi:serine hydrolase domain-containing protein [Sediminibacterium goheungense]|nr:serine hydrolase domain-containing protein [Sediminibacterium goheungense]
MNKYLKMGKSLRLMICLLFGIVLSGRSQDSINTQKEINMLLQGFMKAIETRDSVSMYSFFADVPVTWVGVWKPLSYQQRLLKDERALSVRPSDFKTWFRSVASSGFKQEKFRNPVIVADDFVGSVTFDYSFWVNGKKGNWGKESWGLIKQHNGWKIASVVFSIELDAVKKEKEEPPSVPEIKNGKMESYMQSILADTHFQGTVLVARGDVIIHHAAYGMFDEENSIPNTIHTQFLIGSLTKSFVAIAAMKLVEEKKLDLNEPIASYLPGLNKELSDGVTIHHLMQQQSGLETSFDNLTEYEIMDITPAELLAIINKSKRRFKAGEKYEYTNLNYTVLAMIIESVTGMRYQQYLQTTIFDKAGMQQTGIERMVNTPTNRAIGYRTINGIRRRVHNAVSYAFGAGDIYSTTGDLFRWRQALSNLSILNGESLSTMLTGAGKEWGYYGYGFRIQPYQTAVNDRAEGKLIRHGGTMNGYTSNFHFYQDDQLTVIVLSNYRDVPIRRITYNLKEIALGFDAGQRKNIHEE